MEKIRLRVPSKPEAEFVSMGNYSAELKPKAVVTVESREFADWLVKEYGLAEEVSDKPSAVSDDAGDKAEKGGNK